MAITSGLFDQYLPTKELVGGIATNVKTPTSGFTKEAMTATTAPEKTAQVSEAPTEQVLVTPELLQQMAIGLVPANMAYDFNGDGRITTADARALTLDPTLADPFNTPQPTTDTFDISQIDLDSLDLDALEQSLADLNLDNIDIPTYEDINAALTGGSPTPSSLEGYVSAFNNQVNLLSSAGTLENVDVDDRPYWYNSTVSGILGDNRLDPALLDQFKASAGIPDSFAVYDSGAGITDQSAQTVYELLSSTDDPMQAISEYYGIDLSRAENPDAVYNNADKYGSDADRLAEFQSIIEPVLQKVIPYLQITQGLRYDDALEYAYKNDPMIAAIYNQYGVDLFRQTPDGSTYYFDPISGTESRTVEVKDSSFRDVGLVIAMAGFAPVIGTAVSGALSAMGIPTAITNAVAQAAATAFRTGGDVEAALTSAFTGIDTTATDLATYESYLPSIRTVVQDVYDAANQIDPTTVTPDTTINIDINQTDPITVDEDTGDVTIGLPEPTPETPQETVTDTTGGSGGGATETPSGAVTEPPTATPEPTPEPPAPVEPTPPTPTTPTETDTGVFNPELPWIYQGNGVFVHGETGETVTEDVTDYDPYVVGEGYGRGTDQMPTTPETGLNDTTEETGTGDIFGDLGTIFGDTTTEDTTVDTPTTTEPPVDTTEPSVDTGVDTTTTGGTGGGDGTGDGTGTGDGSGDGTGDGDGGLGSGLLMGASGGAFTPTPYMGSITFAPQLLTPIMPKQSRDYLAELIARLR